MLVRIALTGVLLFSPAAHPQTELDPGTPNRIERSVEKVPESIYEVELKRDLWITAAAASTSLALYVLAPELITPRCPCPISEINSLDRPVVGNRSQAAIVGTDVALTLALLGPMALNWHLRDGFTQAWVEDVLVFAQTLAVASALVTITKVAAQRPLPRTYENDPELIGKAEGYRSFFSGHVTMTSAALTAAAMTFGYRNELGPWPWVAASAVPVAVALGRVAGGVHFYTDVLVGLAVGTATGIAIPWLHHRTDSDWAVLPHPGGLALTYRW